MAPYLGNRPLAAGRPHRDQRPLPGPPGSLTDAHSFPKDGIAQGAAERQPVVSTQTPESPGVARSDVNEEVVYLRPTIALDCIAKKGDVQCMGYAGGKGRLWQDIVSLMPPHDTYIETHLGGGAIMRNKRPARVSVGIDIDADVIRTASAWDVPGLVLHNGDALAFLDGYAFDGRELVYLDPPYMAATKRNRRYYRYEYSDEDHGKLLDTVLQLHCRVMISGYPSPLYEQALRGWEVKELVNVSHAGLRRERIWANFDFSPDLHDYAPIGGSFRERERIRRKTRRWAHRLAQLPDIERRAVLAALIESSDIEPGFAEHLLSGRSRGRAA
jgi:DNA adenine methylase